MMLRKTRASYSPAILRNSGWLLRVCRCKTQKYKDFSRPDIQKLSVVVSLLH
jgi:hypothetical protein